MDYTIIKRRSNIQINEETVQTICEQFNISELTSELLLKKGFSTFGQIEEFISPRRENMNRPTFFRDMEKSVNRILSAVKEHQSIVIYGDYDCDGICSCVILYQALHALGSNVTCFIPDRFDDGYGMNISAVKTLIDNGAELIITVDNGIVAFDEIEYANKRNVDVIVTDHHKPETKLPNAFSIINPKIASDKYPYNDLCGAGVVLKLAEALHDGEIYDNWLIFAAIATVADVVPLTGENRIITSLGLELIKKSINIGLSQLISVAGIKKETITSGTVAFQIAPRINASGRLLSAFDAFRLFTTESEEEAKEIAECLNTANNDRKNIEEDLLKKSEELIIGENQWNTKNILFIKLFEAHEGVIGIVAGKLCEKYNRPTVVCTQNGNQIKGSARSIPGINIYEYLSAAHDLYIKFGGHDQAAGFSISADDYRKVVDCVTHRAMDLDNSFYKHIYYDLEAVSSQLSQKAISELSLFAPYGMKNPHPVYILRGVSLRNLTKIGSQKEHLRANVVHKNCNLQGIGFFKGYLSDELKDIGNCLYDVLFTPSINAYQGKNTIQLEIKDIAQHIDIPYEYYDSLYQFFIRQFESNDYYDQVDSELKEKVLIEQALSQYQSNLFILFDEETLCRAIRYANANNLKMHVDYNIFTGLQINSMNILINPVNIDSLENEQIKVFVLDNPVYHLKYPGFIAELHNIKFLNAASDLFPYTINRNMVAFIYKKLRHLNNLGNQMKQFIDYLNQEGKYAMNYFTVRICLDIMCEMGILEYEIMNDKLYIEFKKISEQKDVFNSSIMVKLMGI